MLIEYKGVPTSECKKFILKKQVKIQAIAALGVTVVFAIPIIIATVLWKSIAVILLVPILAYDLFSVLPPGKNSQKIFMPKRILFDLNEWSIVHECEKMERVHSIDAVVKVVDYGDWYDLIFNYSNRDPYFVCQKSLLARGTIEEFENLFEGKIEKR